MAVKAGWRRLAAAASSENIDFLARLICGWQWRNGQRKRKWRKLSEKLKNWRLENLEGVAAFSGVCGSQKRPAKMAHSHYPW